MKRYILDSNALGDYVNERRGVPGRAAEARRAGHRVGTCPPILGEFFYGLELSGDRDRRVRDARPRLRTLTIWPYGPEAAEEFGRLRAVLRRTGRPMQIIDIELAAVARTLGDCTVVTTDSDLSAVPGLSVENWADA